MRLKLLPALTAISLLPMAIHAASIVETYTFTGLDRAIPDGNPSGLAEMRTILSAIDAITEVRLTLEISAAATLGNTAFNGDLYVYLQHGSAISILLNRVGATAGNPFGYDDNGLSVTFDDAAAHDVHRYRDFVTLAPLAALTGTWQPDGRAVDPGVVLDTTARTAPLGVFNGLDADGPWTLFVADLSTGSQHVLESFTLELKGVPEPGTGALVLAGLGLIASRRPGRRARA